MKLILIIFLNTGLVFAVDNFELRCIHIKGQVNINRKNINKPLLKNTMLQIGDVITTEKGSIALLKSPQQAIKISEQSSFQVTDINKNNQTFTLNSGAIVVSKIRKLMLDALINKAKDPSLVIKTRTAAIGIRGTTFFVYKGINDQTVLNVNQGLVAFQGTASEKELLVAKDSSTMTNEKNQNLKPRKFGFEDKINYSLDPKEKLESSSDLYTTIEATWSKYKKEQEVAWQKQVDSETKKWEKWKEENGN